jgi:CopG family transcriptional regulator / antitoxin EndoAI
MHQRVNITLPEETLRLIDRVTNKRERSRFINEAVKCYIEEMGRTNIRKQLKEGALRRGQLALEIAQEWFPLDEEAWRLKRR